MSEFFSFALNWPKHVAALCRRRLVSYRAVPFQFEIFVEAPLRFPIRCLNLALWAVAFFLLWPSTNSIAKVDTVNPSQAVIVIAGAEGADEFREPFSAWTEMWKTTASHTQLTVIGLGDNKTQSKSQLQKAIKESAADSGLQEIWLVMIGHGTFDGKRAKFNLHGPDIQADEMKAMLEPIKQRLVVLNCTSSSSPFINALSGPNRIIVSATRNGYEYNFARFGQYLSEAIDDPAIDLDKDGQTSILEAFCAASRSVNDFYQQENRIATEHALLDDNGDAKGTPADWFDGVRVNRRPQKGLPDGLLANQTFLKRRGVENSLSAEDRKIRDELETQLEKIRLQKGKMAESEFLLQIEPVMVKLAELYEKTDLENK